jgi:hypothetical protein
MNSHMHQTLPNIDLKLILEPINFLRAVEWLPARRKRKHITTLGAAALDPEGCRGGLKVNPFKKTENVNLRRPYYFMRKWRRKCAPEFRRSRFILPNQPRTTGQSSIRFCGVP